MGNPTKTNTAKAHSLSGDELLEKAKNQTEEVFKAHEVKNTPFAIIEKDGNYSVVLGRYKLHQGNFKSLEEAQDEPLS